MTWNPLSNGRLGSGTADVVRYREQGLRIGMGLDGEASADRADPFANMRAGLYQIRAMYRSAAVLSPYDVLRMHTVGSAEVLHLQDRIGSLAVGKHADFLLLDPSEFTPYKEPYAALVFAAGVEQIRAVYVGGQPATVPASRTDMLQAQARGRVAC
uniref:Deaminase transmembrane protein n=1 Tax=Ralstonia solanacearum TaxID=305 RepID=A0A0S4TQ00_RALSL